MIKIKIKHWSYGGWVEKIVTFHKVGESGQSTEGDIVLEFVEKKKY